MNKIRIFIYNRHIKKTNQEQKTDIFKKEEACLPTREKKTVNLKPAKSKPKHVLHPPFDRQYIHTLNTTQHGHCQTGPLANCGHLSSGFNPPGLQVQWVLDLEREETYEGKNVAKYESL